MIDVSDPRLAEDVRLTLLPHSGDLVVVNPQPKPRTFLDGYWLFIIMVVAPVLASGFYLFAVASDRYVSESQFIVRASSGSGLESAAAMVSSRGLSQAHD